MAAVGVDVWRIHEMEGVWTVVGLYDVKGVPVFHRNVLEPPAEAFREVILGVLQFLRHCPSEVIAERAIHHRGIRHLAESPDGPGPLDGSKELRVGIDVSGVGVDIPTVQGFVDLGFEVAIIHLAAPVEVGQLHIDVIDNLGFCRRLGEQDGGAATEGLRVELVPGDEGKNVLEHRLLSPVIRNWCSHIA